MPFYLPFLERGMTNSYPSPSADLNEEGLLYMYMSAFERSHLSLDPLSPLLCSNPHMLLGPGRFNVGSRKEIRKGKSVDDSLSVALSNMQSLLQYRSLRRQVQDDILRTQQAK